MKLKLYVGGVVALAAGTGAWASLTVKPANTGPGYLVVLLLGLVALSEYAQVRHYMRNNIGAMNLMEGILAPLVVTQTGLTTGLVTLAGLVVANLVRRNASIKTVFNVGMWVTAASIGSVVYNHLSHGFSDRLSVGDIVVATLAMSAVNQALLSGVLKLATTKVRRRLDARTVYAEFISRGLSVAAALATGLVLAVVAHALPAVVATGFVLIFAISAAGRANASVYADISRLSGLQRATHALATSLDTAHALPVFLAEVRAGFEVREAQLVLFAARESTVHTCAGGPTDFSVTVGRHEVAELLRPTLSEPVHMSAGSGAFNVGAAMTRQGHDRMVAAPLLRGGVTVGMLLLYDREGIEGFETGELSVAGALARELVSFFERVDLLKEIDDERRKLADILESTSDGIFSIDGEGVLTSWNTGLVTMTGYRAEEMIGTRHFGLLRARDPNGRDVIIERWLDLIDAQPGLPPELQVVTSDGRTLWLSCSYSRIPAAEGRRDVLVVVARNITQARELERLKDDFVAVVSHELRTPLVPIKGWAQTLINRGDRLTDDQRRTAVQSILSQAQKLESLVLNILEASRIEAGRADGDGVADVGAIAMRIVEDTLAARPDRTVRVRPPSVPCEVRGSAVWVERAVSNLVANAVKYSPDDEAVDVSISAEGSDVVVTVTDRGPGIAADAQERIFERFERLEESRKQTGTGLGLYITRRLARAMGGDVTVSSVPGAGSTFLLRLPAAPVAQRMPEQRTTERDGTVVNLR